MTRQQWEHQVLMRVKRDGGFSMFWVTENGHRAAAATRLVESGKIIRQPDQYPWCAYQINQAPC
ncbi:hypothetical protein HQ393_05115 [Chitinibacter bivalviorum]|uniref:Uncharacterized protein n=1 Tax=Chitinibacter bivalviorum TaxID=2739434 RepID=A0A7H9BG40_9NEIS|nr:hypothetical protein [Chitinibacter bivalviorum]QLG87683.1 hypothetical protein HQ393_05115 [Chitinibacter bivalviorum]